MTGHQKTGQNSSFIFHSIPAACLRHHLKTEELKDQNLEHRCRLSWKVCEESMCPSPERREKDAHVCKLIGCPRSLPACGYKTPHSPLDASERSRSWERRSLTRSGSHWTHCALSLQETHQRKLPNYSKGTRAISRKLCWNIDREPWTWTSLQHRRLVSSRVRDSLINCRV